MMYDCATHMHKRTHMYKHTHICMHRRLITNHIINFYISIYPLPPMQMQSMINPQDDP